MCNWSANYPERLIIDSTLLAQPRSRSTNSAWLDWLAYWLTRRHFYWPNRRLSWKASRAHTAHRSACEQKVTLLLLMKERTRPPAVGTWWACHRCLGRRRAVPSRSCPLSPLPAHSKIATSSSSQVSAALLRRVPSYWHRYPPCPRYRRRQQEQDFVRLDRPLDWQVLSWILTRLRCLARVTQQVDSHDPKQ